MQSARDLGRQEHLEGCALLNRNPNRFSRKSDESNYASGMENSNSFPRGEVHAHKAITREQRDIDRLAAIAPDMQLFQQWKISLHSFTLQLFHYASLKAVSGLDCIPLHMFRKRRWELKEYFCHWGRLKRGTALLIESP